MSLFFCPQWRLVKRWKIVLVLTVSLVLTTPLIGNLISHPNEWVAADRSDVFVPATYRDDVSGFNAKMLIEPATDNNVDVNAELDDKDEEKEEEEGENKTRKKELGAERVRRELLLDPLRNERLSKMYDFCLNRPLGKVENIIYDNRRTSSLCYVPKVGCTYWKNIFRFINNKTGGVVYNTPEEIPRHITHYDKFLLVEKLPIKTEHDQNNFKRMSFLADTFRFMFVRHPIRRLWSAWVDKFFLPDFWFSEGPRLAKLLQSRPVDQACPTNITFNQFLRYVTHDNWLKHPGDANEHWRPIQFLCDPCLFRPHLLGKMETFDKDSEIALSAIDIEPYLEERRKAGAAKAKVTKKVNKVKPDVIWSNSPYIEDKAVQEMRMLTEYNFGRLHSKRVKDCGITPLFVAGRLWKAFQINGHIPANMTLTLQQWDMEKWHKELLRAYVRWPQDKGARQRRQRDQNQKALKESYDRIPLTTLVKIKEMFSFDFFQYGYNFDPV